RAAWVAAPTIPSAISPLACWKARTAASRSASNTASVRARTEPVSGSVTPTESMLWSRPIPARVARIAATSGPRSPRRHAMGFLLLVWGWVPARTYRVARSDAGAAPPGWGNRAVRPRVLREDGPVQEGSAVEDVGELGTQCGLGLGAGDALDHLAPREQQQRGDGGDLVLGGQLLIGLDVHLGHCQLVGFGAGDLVQDRGHHGAGTAPAGPEVHQDRLGAAGGQDGVGEVRLGHVDDVGGRGHDGCSFRGGAGVSGLFGEPALGVDRRGAAGAGGGDGLAVAVVHQVAAGEDAGDGGGGGLPGEDVAVL